VKPILVCSIALALMLAGCAAGSRDVASPGSGAVASTGSQTLVATPGVQASGKTIWRPRPGLSWQLQYSGALAATTAAVVDLDGVETMASQVAALHAAGKKVICYFNAGGYENWRSDRKKFPTSVIGKPLGDWPGERWLDVRKLSTLMPIMSKRMDQCKAKGFDAVDPDNMDGYQNVTGFALKSKHSLAYLKALSKAAHQRGLAIGLKNTTGLIAQALPLVEFAVNEECLRYRECSDYAAAIMAGKAVFHVEYTGSINAICAQNPTGFSTVRKHLSLDAWALYC
jgi:hypothetical protein